MPMPTRAFSTYLSSLALVGASLGVPCLAQDRQNIREWEAVAAAKIRPDDAAQIAQRVIPKGTLLDVDVETIKGEVIYAVELEKDGRVQTVLIDLNTGEVLAEMSDSDGDMDRDEDDDDDE
jgi:Peptidase propeptide and YPEB domain